MSEYLKITIEAPAEQEEELTMLLFDQGAMGVAVDDPALIEAHLARGDWDASVYDGMSIATGRLTLYATFKAVEEAAAVEEICRSIAKLPGVVCSVVELPDVDWQQKWKEAFSLRPVGEKLLIRPCWDQSPLPAGRTVVNIEPGMAFGTGDHATTMMMLELIERYLQPDCPVIDLGCGSGILAIAALKLGASQADGVDIDQVCAEVTERHCQLNGITEQQFHFYCADIVTDTALRQRLAAQPRQLVLANINANIVCSLAASAKELLAPQGVFLSSGILDMYVGQVEAALAAAGLKIIDHRHEEEWNAYAAVAADAGK